MGIFLASKSPRRREILKNLDIDHEIVECDVEEKVNRGEAPYSVAMGLSFLKCNEAAKHVPYGEIVISADTIVVIENKILGKPEGYNGAFEMLKLLRGKVHQVITGYTMIKAGTDIKYTNYLITDVTFKDYDDDLIKWYINTSEPYDKAGAYGIQGKGCVLVEKISGDFFNVIGFPISKIVEDMKKYFDYDPLAK